MDQDIIDGNVTTGAEFEATLGQVLLAATRNGVDPRGSWVYDDGQAPSDWEVMVLELGLVSDTD